MLLPIEFARINKMAGMTPTYRMDTVRRRRIRTRIRIGCATIIAAINRAPTRVETKWEY